jgi:hypothetical protein
LADVLGEAGAYEEELAIIRDFERAWCGLEKNPEVGHVQNLNRKLPVF